MMWSIVLVLYALCFGRGWWKWANTSTWVTLAAGPVLGLWSLVFWVTVAIFVRMFDVEESDATQQDW
jgi:hypothetical protein